MKSNMAIRPWTTWTWLSKYQKPVKYKYLGTQGNTQEMD